MDKRVIDVPYQTLVIPTYGIKGVALTQRCLESFWAQHSFMDGTEIFVISDGEEGAQDLSEVCQVHRANLIVQPRAGFSAACNRGLRQSNGLITYLVNNDIEFIEPSCQILSNVALSLGAGVVGCRLLYPDRTIQHAGVFWAKAAPGAGVPGYWDHLLRGQPERHHEAVSLTNSLCTGALLGIPEWALMTIGYLDERLVYTCSDIAYNLSVIEAGRLPIYCGYTAAIHHEGATRGKTVEEKADLAPDVAKVEDTDLARFYDIWQGTDWQRFAAGGVA